MRENYEMKDEYTEEIPKLLDSDPASAKDTFNPLFQKIISNVHTVKTHSEEHNNSIVSGDGVHGIRYHEKQLQVKKNNEWESVKTGTIIPPANMVKFQAVARNGFVDLYFKEPANTVYQGSVLAEVTGVMIRRSQVDYPKTLEEGELVIDNTNLGLYESSPYSDHNVVNEVEYFYTAFPYTNHGIFNTYWEQNKLSITPERGQVLNITSNENCIVKVYENEVYKTDLSLVKNQRMVYTFDANTACKLVPQLKSANYITPKEQLITITTIEDPKDISINYVYVESFSACSLQTLARTIKNHQNLPSVFKIGDVKDIYMTTGVCRFQIIRVSPTEIKMRMLSPYCIITYFLLSEHSIYPSVQYQEGGKFLHEGHLSQEFKQACQTENVSIQVSTGYDLGNLANVPVNKTVLAYTGARVGLHVGSRDTKKWQSSYTTWSYNGRLLCTKPDGSAFDEFYGEYPSSHGGKFYSDYPEIYKKVAMQINITLRR